MKFEEIKAYYEMAKKETGINKARAMLNVQQMLLSNRSKYGKRRELSMDAHCALALLRPGIMSLGYTSEFGRLHKASFRYLNDL